MATAKPVPISRVPISRVQPAPQQVAKPLAKPAPAPVAKPAPKPAPKPATAESSKPKVTKQQEKTVTPVTKSKSSKKNLGDVYRTCVETNKYYKLPDWTQNPLSLSGAMNHLKKAQNADLLYHGLLRCVGTESAIQEFVDNQENIDALINAGFTEDVSEIGNTDKWLVNLDVLKANRDKQDSWIYQELMANKQVNTKPVKSVDEHCSEVHAYISAIKATRSKTAIKKDPASGLRMKVEEAGKLNKVIDVSKFDKTKISGYKMSDSPKEGGRSRRSRIVSYPISSDNRETLVHFLTAMGLTDDQVNSIANEWSPNNS